MSTATSLITEMNTFASLLHSWFQNLPYEIGWFAQAIFFGVLIWTVITALLRWS